MTDESLPQKSTRESGEYYRHRVLWFLIDFIEQNRYSPSFRDIKEQCELSSTSLVTYYLKQLQHEGWIIRDDKLSRSIRIAKKPNNRPSNIPVYSPNETSIRSVAV